MVWCAVADKMCVCMLKCKTDVRVLVNYLQYLCVWVEEIEVFWDNGTLLFGTLLPVILEGACLGKYWGWKGIMM